MRNYFSVVKIIRQDYANYPLCLECLFTVQVI